MIFRQLFDNDTFTFTYLLGDEESKQCLLIDPVDTQVNEYLTLIKNEGLTLTHVLDTHTHADHVSANGALRERTQCLTLIGEESGTICADKSLKDGDVISFGDATLEVIYTPGHTDDSYSFYCPKLQAVFTGDTLLINGTGRCDFQNGSAEQQFQSLFNKLLALPGKTKVYPGHDYNGKTSSTIDHEKTQNPRLQVANAERYIELMSSLKLPTPKYMDLAVPANQACGDRNTSTAG